VHNALPQAYCLANLSNEGARIPISEKRESVVKEFLWGGASSIRRSTHLGASEARAWNARLKQPPRAAAARCRLPDASRLQGRDNFVIALVDRSNVGVQVVQRICTDRRDTGGEPDGLTI
jgi:hypothetical protein